MSVGHIEGVYYGSILVAEHWIHSSHVCLHGRSSRYSDDSIGTRSKFPRQEQSEPCTEVLLDPVFLHSQNIFVGGHDSIRCGISILFILVFVLGVTCGVLLIGWGEFTDGGISEWTY